MLAEVSKINIARRYASEEGLENALSFLKLYKSDSNILKLFCEELEHDLQNREIFDTISSKNTNTLFGNFFCSYHPYLSLEACSIRDIRPSMNLEQEFDHIRCVIQDEATEGIKHPQVVAIFPENFKGREVLEHDPVYYFVNKFSERHFKYSRPFVSKSKLKFFFSDILVTDVHKTYELIANWVHIHELSHRKGLMAIPQFLREKSGRYSAALEELRADLGVIQYCLTTGSEEAKLTALYVFCERLMAYPLFRERKNFDAISSVILWKYLEERQFFISPSIELLSSGVNGLIKVIQNLENDALRFESTIERKNFLNNFVKDYLGDINKQFDKYHKSWECL
jgi:hypothetical protein